MVRCAKCENVKIIIHNDKKKEFYFKFNYSIMKKICHQRTDRSFFIFGKKLPLCARCLGIYFSFFLGIIIAIIKTDLLMNIKFFQMIILLVICITPLLIDGFTQLYKLRESNNILRLITGLFMGLGCSFFVVFMINKLISFF